MHLNGSATTDSESQRQVPRRDSDSFCVQRAEHTILKKGDKEALRRFLQGLNSRRLEAQTVMKARRNVADNANKRLPRKE